MICLTLSFLLSYLKKKLGVWRGDIKGLGVQMMPRCLRLCGGHLPLGATFPNVVEVFVTTVWPASFWVVVVIVTLTFSAAISFSYNCFLYS